MYFVEAEYENLQPYSAEQAFHCDYTLKYISQNHTKCQIKINII